jgi:multidrug transporter EmrE-like cation transporter
MIRNSIGALITVIQERSSILIISLVLINLVFNIVANASFKVSADSSNMRSFLFWQVIGNIAGLITVLTLTWLLRYLPLSLVIPVTTGLMIIGVQVIASRWIFKEDISPARWAGTLLVVLGIFFLTQR